MKYSDTYCIVAKTKINGKKYGYQQLFTDLEFIPFMLPHIQEEFAKYNNGKKVCPKKIECKVAEVMFHSREITQEDHDDGNYLDFDIGETIQEHTFWRPAFQVKIP